MKIKVLNKSKEYKIIVAKTPLQIAVQEHHRAVSNWGKAALRVIERARI